MSNRHRAQDTGNKRSRVADIVLFGFVALLLVLTFFALYLEKRYLCGRILNTAIAAIATDYYKHVCPAKDCQSELQNMTTQLRNALTEATDHYATELVPQWGTQSLVVGFVGFLMLLLGFKRFEVY